MGFADDKIVPIKKAAHDALVRELRRVHELRRHYERRSDGAPFLSMIDKSVERACLAILMKDHVSLDSAVAEMRAALATLKRHT